MYLPIFTFSDTDDADDKILKILIYESGKKPNIYFIVYLSLIIIISIIDECNGTKKIVKKSL